MANKYKDTKGLSAASQAKTARGTTFYFAEVGETYENATWTKIDGMKSGTIPVPEKAELEVTSLESTAKEYIAILGDTPDLAVDLDYYPLNSVHQRLLAEISQSDENRWWKIVMPNSLTFYVFGYVQGWPVAFAGDTQLTATLTIKTSGKSVFVMPASGASIAWSGTLTGNNDNGTVTGTLTGALTAGDGNTITFTKDVANNGELEQGTHYTIENVPLGLTPVLTKVDDKNVKLSFTGTALVTETVNNIDLRLTSSAFVGALASSIEGFAKTDVTITFA